MPFGDERDFFRGWREDAAANAMHQAWAPALSGKPAAVILDPEAHAWRWIDEVTRGEGNAGPVVAPVVSKISAWREVGLA